MVECNPLKSTRILPLVLNTSQFTTCNYLKKIGKVSKLGVSVLHILTEKNKEDRKSMTSSLLSRQGNDQFLKHIIAADENRVFMTMVQGKGCKWTRMKFYNLPQRQSFMKEKLWNVYGWITVLLFTFSLNGNQTFNTDLFTQQLQPVHENLLRKRLADVKRSNFVQLSDNARIKQEKKSLNFG